MAKITVIGSFVMDNVAKMEKFPQAGTYSVRYLKTRGSDRTMFLRVTNRRRSRKFRSMRKDRIAFAWFLAQTTSSVLKNLKISTA